jgi:hypothetical protein
VNKIPHSVRHNLAAQRPGGEHPDADQLTAFSEQQLSGAERESVLAHLAACAECREIVALATPEPAATQPTFVPARSWWSVRSFKWGAAAAAVAMAALGLALLRPSQRQPESQVAQVAQKSTTLPSAPAPRADETRSTDSVSRYAGVRSELPTQRNSEARKPVVRHPGNAPEQPTQNAGGGMAGGTVAPTLNEELAGRAKNDAAFADKQKSEADQYAFSASTAPAPQQKSQVSEVGALSRNAAKDTTITADSAKAKTPSVSETVEVTSEAPMVAAESKSKPSVDTTTAAQANAAPANQRQAAGQAAGAAVGGLQKTARRASKQSEAGAPTPSTAAFTLNTAAAGSQTAWRINAGRLQHLDPDLGRWNDVAVNTAARLSVVGSAGNEVWVGGSGGAMFYSNDSGEHWVPVSTGGWDKTATIVGLTPTARQSVEVHLSNGERWRSADAGASWNKYQ